ncbi:YhcH/YjgK/YiaL family protein [Prosthecobacter sp.]|uniref:YhcH/YjgK/YiaL family protein n=1 Tax=Prosthecobacter sp. TaxID=1965333 RepID=UPI002ABC525F|nr:YhcH/YjgK/YiaL family protein [Prosthecobacter sp.]MDZ4402015.1 YhcH/YjgK/YiaL family protein [Prosthecobacter sp.]
MILDTLDHAARYESLNSRFAKAFAFLRTVDGTQALGRHDLDGDLCFALVQTYETKPLEKAKFEAHRKYIDVQFIFSGQETILWAPLASMQEETMAYSEEKEAALWKLTPDFTPLHVSAGHFAILWPQDAHAPCVEWEKPEQVFKVVVKVAVQ